MAGLQSCFRGIVVTANLRIIQKNGVLRQVSRGRHSLAFQILSRNNPLHIKKPKVLVNSFYKYNIRLASTNITDKENITTQLNPVSESVEKSTKTTVETATPDNFVFDETSLPPIPTVEDPSQIQTVLEFVSTGLKEPSFESLGLYSYWPSGLLRRVFEFLHIQCDLPWWGVIVVVTLTFRLLLLPFTIKAKKNAAELSIHMPVLQKMQMKLTEARNSGNYYDSALQLQEIASYSEKHQLSIFKSFLPQLVQSPVFLSMYFALKGMTEAPVKSLETGGLFWFKDLTIADPYYILPCVVVGTLLIALETGVEGGSLSSISTKPWIPYVFRGCCLITLPIIISVPQGILWYWTVSNCFTLFQIPLLKMKSVKKFFGIPEMVRPPPTPGVKKKSMSENFREGLTNFRLTRELQERDYLNSVTFEKAGKAPIQRTFKKNPKLKEIESSK